MTITVYRVPTGEGDSFNEFPSLAAADAYRAAQGITAPAYPIERPLDPSDP